MIYADPPTEEVAIYRALEPAEKDAAKNRMSEAGKVGKVSTPSGKARDKLGALVEAAEAEPEKYAKLVAIAGDARLSNRQHVSDLPSSWRTLPFREERRPA